MRPDSCDTDGVVNGLNALINVDTVPRITGERSHYTRAAVRKLFVPHVD